MLKSGHQEIVCGYAAYFPIFAESRRWRSVLEILKRRGDSVLMGGEDLLVAANERFEADGFRCAKGEVRGAPALTVELLC